MMNETAVLNSAKFRRKAIKDLEKLKDRYLKMVNAADEETDKSRINRFEKAVRLLPGLLKTEENFLISLSETERRERLERELEPLFRVLRKVLGAEFDRKREDIIKALEAELKRNGT